MNMQDDLGPEQTYFDDPAVDRLLAMVMTLASELWVVKDRLHALESLLGQQDLLAPGQLDEFTPGDEDAKRLEEERRLFVKSLMDNILAREQSKSGPA